MTRKIIVAGLEIEIKELSVAEVRQWINDAANQQSGDAVDYLLFDDVALYDLYCFTNLNQEIADGMTPAELRKVIDSVRELNPHFFTLRERIVAMGREFLANHPNASENSK